MDILYPDKEDVLAAFKEFLRVYDSFREGAGLAGKEMNPFEACTALGDKNGRICRHIKHTERNDPKDTWPDEMIEEGFGWITYFMLLVSHYNLNVENGILSELAKAIEQHSSGDKNDDQNS